MTECLSLAQTPRQYHVSFLGFSWPTINRYLRYGFAVCIVAIALVMDHLLGGVLLGNVSFVFLAAVMITALCAGYDPALLAVLLSIIGLEYLFWIPAQGGQSAIGLGVGYGLVASMIAYVTGTVRTLTSIVFRNAGELGIAVKQRDELLSVISEDFRIHLTALKFDQGLLRLAPTVDGSLARRFELVDREMSGLTSLVDNVIEISKADTWAWLDSDGGTSLIGKSRITDVADAKDSRIWVFALNVAMTSGGPFIVHPLFYLNHLGGSDQV